MKGLTQYQTQDLLKANPTLSQGGTFIKKIHYNIYLPGPIYYIIMVRKTRGNRDTVHEGRVGCETVSYIVTSSRRGYHLLKHAVIQSFKVLPVEGWMTTVGFRLEVLPVNFWEIKVSQKPDS